MPTIRANTAVDPSQIADMFNPLAKALAPPTAQEILAGAKGRQIAQQIQQTKDLYDYAAQPGFDQQLYSRRLAAAGIQNENASMEAVDRNNANARFTNAADNARALDQTRMQQTGETTRTLLAPVSEGATRFVPPSIAGAYGLPSQQVGVVKTNEGQVAALPGGGTVEGREKPLTETDVRGAILRGLPAQDQRSVAMQGVGNTNVLTPDGKVVVTPNDRAAGMTPAPAEFKPQMFNYDTPDGRSGTAATGPDNKLRDTQNGAELPQGSKTYTAQLSGSKADTGLSAGVTSGLQQRRVDLEMMKQTAGALRKIATESPNAVGTTGAVQGLIQNVIATGGEVANMLGGQSRQYIQQVESGLLGPDMGKYFDSKIPEAQLYENTLLAQYAKMLDPGGKLSDQRMKQAAEALGVGGYLRSAKNTISTLDALDRFVAQQQDLLDRGDPRSSFINAPAGAPTAAPARPAGAPARRRYNPATGALE